MSNALAAVASCGEAGLDAGSVAAAMAAGGGVPGRFERIDAGQPFTVVVDYAHKPDAVRAALESLRPAHGRPADRGPRVPAATVTPASGRSWATSPRGSPTWSS